MTLDLPRWGDPTDREVRWPVTGRETVFTGHVLAMSREQVRTPHGEMLTREVVEHPGAVAILAVDDDDTAVVVRQYRHPIGHELIEIPAGLLDAPGEDPWTAARRELAEETLLAADEWHLLADIATSPGGNRETLRIFLARGLHPTPRPEGFVVEGEEAHMSVGRVGLAELFDGILAGRLANSALSVAVPTWLAAGQDVARLRPPDAPWPMRRTVTDRS